MEMAENLNEKEPKLYEIGYLLSPLVPEEGLIGAVNDNLRQPIEAAGGAVVSETAPTMRSLAYQVKKEVGSKRTKYQDAYFGALRFSAAPKAISQIKEAIDRLENVLRFMIIIAPKDNPPRRAPRRPQAAKVVVVDEAGLVAEKPAPMSTEDIDKEIEGMLAKV